MIPSKGKDSDSSDSRKTFILLIFDLLCRFFWIFLLFFFPSPYPHPPGIVVVNFFGGALRNPIKF